MKKNPFIVILACLSTLVTCSSCRTHFAHPKTASSFSVDTTGLRDAVAIATSAIIEKSPYPADDYVLVSVQQLVLQGKYIWRVTFKPAKLLPKDPSNEMVGAGGEIFVNIDPKTKRSEIRYGE